MTLEDWKLVVGLVATVLGGLWTVFVYFDKKRGARDDRPAPERGAASGELPPAAVLIVLAGLALVGWSVFFGADRSTVVHSECGPAVGGNIDGSTINLDC